MDRFSLRRFSLPAANQMVTRAVLVVVAMSMLGTHAQQRVPPDPDAMAPADLILFDSRTSEASENIFVIRPDGSGLRQLTSAVRGSALSYARMASWSSDRRQIVFAGYDEEGYKADRGDIYLLDADGTNLTRLDCPDDGGCSQPRWSPDNKHILFIVSQVGEAESAIFVMRADGQNPRQLSPWGMWGTWSPNGEQIAFSSLGRVGTWQEGDPIDLFVMNTAGSNSRRLTEQQGVNQDPDWSPDGRRLVFDSTRDGGNYEIYTMELDTGLVRRLTDHPAADARPAFSPDGQHIVFHSNRGDNGQSDLYDLYVMDRDGSNLRRLTKLGAEGGPNAAHPDW